jgi:hypothetical protein
MLRSADTGFHRLATQTRDLSAAVAVSNELIICPVDEMLGYSALSLTLASRHHAIERAGEKRPFLGSARHCVGGAGRRASTAYKSRRAHDHLRILGTDGAGGVFCEP